MSNNPIQWLLAEFPYINVKKLCEASGLEVSRVKYLEKKRKELSWAELAEVAPLFVTISGLAPLKKTAEALRDTINGNEWIKRTSLSEFIGMDAAQMTRFVAGSTDLPTARRNDIYNELQRLLKAMKGEPAEGGKPKGRPVRNN